MTIHLPDRLAGGIWGHLVGDATGVPYEGRPPMLPGAVAFGVEGGSWHQPPGTWSDDGALMLALLDSLLWAGFDLDDQGQRIRDWFEEGAYTPDDDGLFDIGATTRRAIGRLQAGVPAAEAGPTDETANGNGSLMRIAPLALVMRDASDDALVAMARQASRVTHGTAIAQLTCALYVLTARRLLAGSGRAAALADATETLTAIVSGNGGATGDGAALEVILTWSERHGRGYVVDSFWSAWNALSEADSYEATIRRAIAYGHDTDTTAAIAGGLAGIRFGWKAIPVEWRRGLRDHARVNHLVDRVLETDGVTTSSAKPYRVDFVDLGQTPLGARWPGHLGMTILPGQKRWSVRSYRWRDLEADLAHLHGEIGADALVVLVEDFELDRVGVPELASAASAAGLALVRHSVEDMGLPADRDAYGRLVARLTGDLIAGRTVAVACMGGLGRTGTLVGCLLREAGLDGDAALALARAARPGVAESSEQETWVRDWQPVTV